MKKIIFLLFTTISLSLSAAPQAVVFDFGEVMTGKINREPIFEFLCDSLGLTKEEAKRASLERRHSGKADVEFWVDYAEKNGKILPENWVEGFMAVLKISVNINPAMFALVDELKEKQIPVALLSNIDNRLANMIKEFGFYAPFEPCLLSCEIGAEKPDSKAFQILLDTLRFPSGDIVFIDDRADNVEAAKAMGIDAIVFVSVEQIRSELKKRELL